MGNSCGNSQGPTQVECKQPSTGNNSPAGYNQPSGPSRPPPREIEVSRCAACTDDRVERLFPGRSLRSDGGVWTSDDTLHVRFVWYGKMIHKTPVGHRPLYQLETVSCAVKGTGYIPKDTQLHQILIDCTHCNNNTTKNMPSVDRLRLTSIVFPPGAVRYPNGSDLERVGRWFMHNDIMIVGLVNEPTPSDDSIDADAIC